MRNHSQLLSRASMTHKADMQLVARVTPPGVTNLAIGEPVFLQDAMGAITYGDWHEEKWPGYGPCDPEGYPPSEGLQELRDVICSHGHVVVANGAKQALLASLWALRQRGCQTMYTPKPYWPCFPTLARHADMVPQENIFAHVNIVCWPNNPTGYDHGLLHSSFKQATILDAVYDHEVYAPIGASPWPTGRPDIGRVDITIGSASKWFGLSGLRLGWAVFEDPELAASAAEYIETTTSGVSVASQKYFLSVVNRIDNSPALYKEAIADARMTLAKNIELFNQYLNPTPAESRWIHSPAVSDVKGAPAGMGGMFAFFAPGGRSSRPEVNAETWKFALNKAGVQLVDGAHCGMHGYYRMSLGVRTADLESALQRLVEGLRG